MPFNFNSVGNFFSGLSDEASRALDTVRNELDVVVEVALDIQDLPNALRVNAPGVLRALEDAGRGFTSIAENIGTVGRVDSALARSVADAVEHFGRVSRSAADQIRRDAVTTDSLDLISATFEPIGQTFVALRSIQQVGDPDGIISGALSRIEQELGNIGQINVLTVADLVSQAVSAIDARVGQFTFDPSDPGAFAADLGDAVAALSDEIAFGSSSGLGRLNFVSLPDALATISSTVSDAAEAIQSAPQAAVDSVGALASASAQIKALANQIANDGVINQLENPGLDIARQGLDAARGALEEAVAFVRERAELDAFVDGIAETGWEGALDTPFLEAISGDGAVFGNLVSDIARFVDFEAIGNAFQDIGTLDIDLSAATLDRYARLLDLPQELITPQLAGVLQQLTPEALAGVAASTGAILQSIANGAEGAFLDGLSAAQGFLSDLAAFIGDGFLGIVDYLQAQLERFAVEYATDLGEAATEQALAGTTQLLDDLAALATEDGATLLETVRDAVLDFGDTDALVDLFEDSLGAALSASQRARLETNLDALIDDGFDASVFAFSTSSGGGGATAAEGNAAGAAQPGVEGTQAPRISAAVAPDDAGTAEVSEVGDDDGDDGEGGGVDTSLVDVEAGPLEAGAEFSAGLRIEAGALVTDGVFGGELGVGLVFDLLDSDLANRQVIVDAVAEGAVVARVPGLGSGIEARAFRGVELSGSAFVNGAADVLREVGLENVNGVALELDLGEFGFSGVTIGAEASYAFATAFLPNTTDLLADPTAEFRLDDIPDLFNTSVAAGAGLGVGFSLDGGGSEISGGVVLEAEVRAALETALTEDGANEEEFEEALFSGALDRNVLSTDGLGLSPDVIAEVGSVVVDHTGGTVIFQNDFENPVVFTHVATANGLQAVTSRVTDVRSDGFDLFLQEPETYDVVHAPETVSFIVVEEGTHVLSDGTVIAAETVDTSLLSASGHETVELEGFSSRPTVLAGTQTFNDTDFVDTRIASVSAGAVEVALEEEQLGQFSSSHGVETIGVLAIESGQGLVDGLVFEAGSAGYGIDHTASRIDLGIDLDEVPIIFADLTSQNGNEPARARTLGLDEDGFSVFAEEDTSVDRETAHLPEAIDFLAFGQSGLIYGDTFEFV